MSLYCGMLLQKSKRILNKLYVYMNLKYVKSMLYTHTYLSVFIICIIDVKLAYISLSETD